MTIGTQVQPYLADCPPEQNVPTKTRWSQLGNPPETISPLERYGGFVCAVTLSGLALVLLVPFILPLLLLWTAVRRIWKYYACSSYHTHPSELKIAVVGGGWSGVQIVSRLKELGVQDLTGFEKNDDLGGTWHPNLRYHSVQIHGAMWMTGFDKYEYCPGNWDISSGKVLGGEALAYVRRFANHRNISPHYRFNSSVTSVRYDSSKRQATLVVEDAEGNPSEEGPYDFVVYASQASVPNLPFISGQDRFKGKILHSLSFKTTQFEEIVESKARVVIVGGSKTACDMVLCFQRAGYDSFHWVFRKPYIFWKYELMFHQGSFTTALRGMTTVVSLFLSLVSTKLMGFILWCSGMGVTYGKRHMDWDKFHWGILCPKQRQDLAKIPEENCHQSGIECLHADALELKNGEKLPADYVLLGTGCKSGLNELSFEKDGKPFPLEEQRMLHSFFAPRFPVFANSTALWTTFGPKRAVNSADLMIYHLCVRKRLTEEQMMTMASRQLGDSKNVDANFLFLSRGNNIRNWLVMHTNLMGAGLLDVQDFLWHAIEIFCLSRQTTLRFDVLPKTADRSTGKEGTHTVPNKKKSQ